MSDLNKPRHLSLPLDYFKGGNRVHRWKARLGWGVFAFTLGGLLLHWLGSREPHFGASPGPVASPHQAWDQTCSACHEPFQVTSSHSWAPPGMEHATGQSCQSCHAGPAHHVGQTPELNCAACHREHQGRDFSLVKMADSHCTQCHVNLADHGGKGKFEKVSAFAKASHPDFRSIASDPGKIQFNHALHMTPGMAVRGEGGLGGATMRLKDLPEPYRERYSAMQSERSPDAPVTLSCRSCHQLEASDFKLSREQASDTGLLAASVRSPGAYFQPIGYENQCKACHPLSVSDPTGDKKKSLTVPHRKQPSELRRWLDDYFTAQAARGIPGFEETKITRPLPGKKFESPIEPKIKKVVDANVARAVRELYDAPLKKNCRLCHTMDEKNDYAVAPSSIPQVWFEHARFDHMAHRAVDCRECHAKAYGMTTDGKVSADASQVSRDVLVPSMDNCVQCHAAAATRRENGVSHLAGGVRHDCVLCHQYHHGAQPRAGRGAEARGAGSSRWIQQFLKGSDER